MADLAEQFLIYYGEGDSRRAHVFLGSSIDEGIFGHIHRTGHYVGGHIRNQWNWAVHIVTDFGSIDGVVGGYMEIVQVARDFISLRNIGIGLIC